MNLDQQNQQPNLTQPTNQLLHVPATDPSLRVEDVPRSRRSTGGGTLTSVSGGSEQFERVRDSLLQVLGVLSKYMYIDVYQQKYVYISYNFRQYVYQESVYPYVSLNQSRTQIRG